MFDKRQEKLFGMVRDYFRKNKPDNVHDMDHIMRVVCWTELVSRKEKADPSITIPAALLHDIAIPKYGDGLHARKGAEMCKPFLKKCGYSTEEIGRISETISMHSTDDPNPPKTLEARVLFDADKLDASGPAGLHRWFISYSNIGFLHKESLERILTHLEKWKKRYGDPPFFTPTGRKLGGPRMRHIEDACKSILNDMERFEDVYKRLETRKPSN